jgi:diguanylate cyclase (GGDEF)-like protein
MYSNRWKLIAAVGLLFVPIILFGGLFVSQSNKDIRFAKRELVGVKIAAVTMPFAASLFTGNLSEIETAKVQFLTVARKNAVVLNVANELDQLTIALDKNAGSPQKMLEALQYFLVKVSDKSNLTLDPDLASFYLMEVLITRMPAMIGKIDNFISARKFHVASDQASSSTPDANSSWRYTDLIVASSQIPQLRTEISSAMAKSFNASGPRRERAALETESTKLFATLLRTYRTEMLASNQESKQIRADVREPSRAAEKLRGLVTAQNNLNHQAELVSALLVDELNYLLTKRINELHDLMLTLGIISSALALISIVISLSVFRATLSELDQRVLFLAHHDELTGLRNRNSFMSDTMKAISLSAGHSDKVALHVIDLDNFKSINDTRGHPAGDKVLRRAADVLKASLPPKASVARFGGDEFVVLQPNVLTPGDAEEFALLIVNQMRQGLEIDGISVRTTVSIGSAVSSSVENNAERLMQAADIALYAAKAAGRDQASMFSEQIALQLHEVQHIEREVRRGLAEQAFFLEFQPQYDVTGKTLHGFEALLRLKDENGHAISPADFIPAAERLKLIHDIGRWVLGEACMIAATWPDHLILAVNLSSQQFGANFITNEIGDALRASGLPSHRLQVEITESILLKDSKEVIQELQTIRSLGVSVAMDDFGTGYSSLSYLWQFPIDKLKIDKSFITALGNGDLQALNVLRTVIVLGHSLGMKVTAEGVETQVQADTLTALNCDEIQGYLYGRPMPVGDVNILLMKTLVAKAAVNTGKKAKVA